MRNFVFANLTNFHLQMLGQPAASAFEKKQQIFEIILPAWRPQKSAFAPHELEDITTLTEPKAAHPTH